MIIIWIKLSAWLHVFHLDHIHIHIQNHISRFYKNLGDKTFLVTLHYSFWKFTLLISMNILLHFVLNQTCLDFGAAFGGIFAVLWFCCCKLSHTTMAVFVSKGNNKSARLSRYTRVWHIGGSNWRWVLDYKINCIFYQSPLELF